MNRVAQSQRSPSEVSQAPAQGVTPEKEPHCEKTFFAATATPDLFFFFFFFKLPPYSLMYGDPYTFQQLQLPFRIGLSSPGFTT